MTEYVEREAAKEAVVKAVGKGYSPFNAIVMLPAANVQPVVRGEWVEMFDDYDDGYLRKYWLCCSVCGHVAPYGRMSDTELHTKYCPNCGAMMGKED